MNIQETLDQLVEYELKSRELAANLIESGDREALISKLAEATRGALEADGTDEVRDIRLRVVAELWAELGTEEAARWLLRMLTDESHEVSLVASQALIDLASVAFGAFETAFRELLDKPGSDDTILEVVEVLKALDDPGSASLLPALLEHPSADVIGAAMELAGEHSMNPAIRRKLEELTTDPRPVLVLDDQGLEREITLGELASDYVAALRPLWETTN